MESGSNLGNGVEQSVQSGTALCPTPTKTGDETQPESIPTLVRAIVPRIPNTPIPMNAGQVFFVAMLSGTLVPTMIAYVLDCNGGQDGPQGIPMRPIEGDFARYENGEWRLVDSFRDLEELEAFSMLDGMRYAGLIEESYESMDEYAFRIAGDPRSVPTTRARWIIPAEILKFVEEANQATATKGTPLFPYLSGSLDCLHASSMTERDDAEAASSSDAGVFVNRWTGETYEQVPWRWDEYENGLAVLVDDQGNEMLEFDEEEMLVRKLPDGLPGRMLVDRRHLSRHEARRRGMQVDDSTESRFWSLRASKVDSRLHVRAGDPASDRWVGRDGYYILQKANGAAILGVDANRMRIYLADGRIAECSGDPGCVFEIAVYLAETGVGAIGDRDITGASVPISIESIM